MMKYIDTLFLSSTNKYTVLIFYTILTLIIGKALIYILKKQLIKINNNRLQYKTLNFIKLIISIIQILIIYLIWENNIKNAMTLISFVSAAITLSLKDYILNLFAGFYIKLYKPFKLEDRIEIKGQKGDVINLGSLFFELLEISDNYGHQSTGVVSIIPNSIIFTETVKNMNKGFKYIWDEIKVQISLDSDVILAKKTLYKIINNIDVIKNIPTKMKNELKNNASYRMYYNKYEPMIYTEVKDKHIELNIRFLINPKKARLVESYIWNEILKEYKNENIQLIKE